MGLDLSLLPFDADHGDFAYSHTILNCDRDYKLFDAIQKVPQMKVPEGFTTYLSRDEKYEEVHYGKTIETPYGEPLMFAEVESLLKHKKLVHQASVNRAVWAYLENLPPRTKVALYWS